MYDFSRMQYPANIQIFLPSHTCISTVKKNNDVFLSVKYEPILNLEYKSQFINLILVYVILG